MEILGHERTISYLEALLEKGFLPHAFLFYGPEGVGKKTIAREFLKAFFCSRNPKKLLGKNCGRCDFCLDFDSNKSGDIIEILLDRFNPIAKEIGIDSIRRLKKNLIFSVPQEKLRAVFIDPADKMTVEAQNAFLKILEEPPERTVFILIVDHKDLLLATIVSRALPVRFSPVGRGVLEDFLKKRSFPDKKIIEILDIACGRPAFLFRSLNDNDFFLDERKKLADFREIIFPDPIFQFKAAEKISQDTKEIESFFNLFYSAAHNDILKINFDWPIARFIKLADEIYTAIITTNVNPRLALETLFLELSQ